MSDPSSTSDDPGKGEKGPAGAAAAQPKPIEKIKPEFEKLPTIEKNFLKPEFKEHKPEFKEQKNEAKEFKPEFKEHKNEAKEHKNEAKEHKPEFKELKIEKQEIKELKESKLEAKELEKPIQEKGLKEQVEGGPLGGFEVNPVAGLGREALEQHAAALEGAAAQLRHFIEQSDRPDTGEGALRNEPDQEG
jgi:predicted RNase H-like nuclease (RuvC/YqgF family)